jgi:hypothetical protein
MTTNPHIGSSFDDFLTGQGAREETFAVASKRVLAWQIAQAMEAEHLDAAGMAERMGTTASEVGRLLDPTDDTVQLGTLRRAADAVGRKVRLELT